MAYQLISEPIAGYFLEEVYRIILHLKACQNLEGTTRMEYALNPWAHQQYEFKFIKTWTPQVVEIKVCLFYELFFNNY